MVAGLGEGLYCRFSTWELLAGRGEKVGSRSRYVLFSGRVDSNLSRSGSKMLKILDVGVMIGYGGFACKRDESKVLVGDVVGVRICDVKLSERYVWFEFTGVVETPAQRV